MSGYSGEASFTFEVERYQNRADKTYHHLHEIEKPQQNEMVQAINEALYEYVVLPLEVEGRSYFQPGKLYGPPENCYPDEGETEIISVIGPDGQDWSDLLTESERDSVTEMIQDQVMDGCDEPDYDDEPYFDEYDFEG